jgi:hypothetical protein
LLLWRSRKDLGADGPIPAVASIRQHEWSAAELGRAQPNAAALPYGTPEQVKPRLVELAGAHGVAELVANTLTHDPADRLRSYQLLTEVVADANPVATQVRGRRPDRRLTCRTESTADSRSRRARQEDHRHGDFAVTAIFSPLIAAGGGGLLGAVSVSPAPA